jgi:hypothetical protein
MLNILNEKQYNKEIISKELFNIILLQEKKFKIFIFILSIVLFITM